MKSNDTTLTVDTAVEILKGDIVSGKLTPDAPLRLMALSKYYDIGYTPLREALSRLEEQRFVVLSPNRGYRVAPVSMNELEDLEYARQTVEGALLADAITQGDLAWESAVVAAHHRLSRCSNPADDAEALHGDWLEAHDAFHQALVSAARSAWLKSFYGQLSVQLRRHHQTLLFHPEAGAPRQSLANGKGVQEALQEALSLAHHTALMDAALSRDVAHAEALMREHAQFTLAVYRAAVAEA